jgi:hypothetical protein
MIRDLFHIEELTLCLCASLQVRSSVVRTLPSADVDDMPVIIRFLLQTVIPADAFQV